MREISALREFVEKLTIAKSSGGNEWKESQGRWEEEFGGLSTEVDDDGSRSIRTIVPHELERVEEEDEKRMATQEDEEEEERRARRVKLERPRNLSP